MKVITDYFSSPLAKSVSSESTPLLNDSKSCSSQEDDSKCNDDVYYETRRIRIRLVDPAVPDSYICEVYDTSQEDSIDEDIPLTKVAQRLSSKGIIIDKSKDDKCKLKLKSDNSSAGIILGERNKEETKRTSISGSESTSRRHSSRAKKPVAQLFSEPDKKRSTTPKESSNAIDRSSIHSYFKPVDEKKAKKSSGQKENDGLAMKQKVPLASIFLPPPKKPKLDPEVERSRKAFLQSGLPEVLKKPLLRIQCVQELELFPVVVHVQQRCENILWKKRPCTFSLRKEMPYDKKSFEVFHWICNSDPSYILPKVQSRKLDKRAVQKLKIAYKQVPIELMLNNVTNLHRFKKTDELWSEKYKPSSEGFLGNEKTVNILRDWLREWKHHKVGSENEGFGSSDEEECGPKRFCLLEGPIASGKTSVVYALAAEMDLNVIEVNASSKRPGKKLIADVQEATRSHEVREKAGSAVILVEDADIVFEEDEGFVSALQSLVTSSKRPVILLVSDPTVSHLERFRGSGSLQLQMVRPHSSTACALLELICHVEGRCPPRSSLLNLLYYNKMDLRRSLLELQFWNASGGWEVESSKQLSPSRLWWASHERLFGKMLWHQTDDQENEKIQPEENLTKLNAAFLRSFDCLSDADVLGGRSKLVSVELGWNQCIARDSLSFKEDFCTSNWQADDTILNFSTTVYKMSCHSIGLNRSQPPSQRKWAEVRKSATSELEVGLPRGAGRSGALDYFPTLRTILRAELESASQSRRRSRGCHYLRALGISLSTGSIPVVSSAFRCERIFLVEDGS